MLISFVRGEPALLINKEKTIVVGDLHIGLDQKFRREGIHFPKATEKLTNRLLSICERTNAKSLVLLGDIKESIGSPGFGEYREIKNFFEAMEEIPIQIVKGNHDGNMETVLKNIHVNIPVRKEIILGDVAMAHGNSWPSEEALNKKYLVVGHAHYAIQSKDRIEKIWLVSKNKKSTLVVMPPFNELISGSVLEKWTKDYLPMFKNKMFSFEQSKVYGLDKKALGKVKDFI